MSCITLSFDNAVTQLCWTGEHNPPSMKGILALMLSFFHVHPFSWQAFTAVPYMPNQWHNQWQIHCWRRAVGHLSSNISSCRGKGLPANTSPEIFTTDDLTNTQSCTSAFAVDYVIGITQQAEVLNSRRTWDHSQYCIASGLCDGNQNKGQVPIACVYSAVCLNFRCQGHAV